jgi:D-sedoheptulose 7-phosphate isomerase
VKKILAASLADHRRCLDALEQQAALLGTIADVTYRALAGGHRVYLAGNGGSAADAQHIAAELIGRFHLERRALPAVALTTDTSVLTALTNDYGYERAFARQIEGLVQVGDVVWLLSTSGSSLNVLAAAEAARKIGATVIGFTGAGGGRLKPLCDYCLTVSHTASDRIQEIHQLAYHMLCDRIEQLVASESDSSA